MSLQMSLYGEWQATLHDLRAYARNLERASQAAITKEAHHWANEVRSGIRKQTTATLARPPWPSLKPSTVERKGSSKALIDTGTLLRSIKAERVSRWRWHIGVRRGAKSKNGKSVVNIAAVHEFGTTIGVVSERGPVKIVIPARPFLRPIHRVMSKELERRLMGRLAEEMGRHLTKKASVI
jgi:phage gpG-like protein